MKKQVFRIVRRYRKSFAILASKHPKLAMDFWHIYHDKTEGVMDLFATDSNVPYEQYILVNRYFESRW